MTARGKLRVYLGAAPGVGKTYRMLEEGQRRKSRGTDVVIGYVEPHDRPLTSAMADGLEAIPRRQMTHRGAAFTEMDLDAVIARRPKVALVDEMAHTNVPGSLHEKRWQDIDAILDAGIDVITTVNIQHLESLNDVVEQITGVTQQETIPDAVVRTAEQIELVDMTAEALRRRMAHGNIYKPDKVDAALGNYFRVGNLTALRELALLWLADKVDEQLDRYRRDHDIEGTWEARERVVVALTGGPEGDTLIRRAARIAERARGADLLAVHVVHNEGLNGSDPAHLARQRTLIEDIGGTYHQVVGDHIPQALLSFARGVNATQLVLGASRRGRFAQLFSRGIGVTTVAESETIDVHLVTHEESRRPRLRRSRHRKRDESLWRLLLGLGLTAVLMPTLALVLRPFRDDLSLSSLILIFLAAVVAISLVGRLWAALAAAVVGSLLLNFFFTPPVGTWTIAETENVFALIVFLLVAVTVSATVNLAVRRTQQAARARREANALAVVAGSVLRGSRPLAALLGQLRESFALDSVTLLERNPEGPESPIGRLDSSRWSIAESVGTPACLVPRDGDVEVAVDDTLTLVLKGRTLDATDQRVVEAFAVQAALALRQQRLAEQAAAAVPIAEADKLRTALLRAVSHDLRAPLASAKAAVQGLRTPNVVFDETDRQELLATADESLDLLTRLVENLLDMSRLQAGALGVHPQPTSVAEVIPLAVDELGSAADAVQIQVADDLPEVMADPALLQRILANLLSNALKFSPPDAPPTVAASALADRLHIRVIDHGPGLPSNERDRTFLPFQRSGDRHGPPGIGLGLALSRGLAEAMGGSLEADDTPGGGLTMDLALVTAPHHEPAPEPEEATT
ncbi:sensor histidine kinase KdpD [Nocardioides koreensis]|uniref:histidine kinase n=1 Tax=Nocardioides koreensis TaxID=433651 RepID=A0ABP5LHZ1_9ACTN